jgi:hypothetical protein
MLDRDDCGRRQEPAAALNADHVGPIALGLI